MGTLIQANSTGGWQTPGANPSLPAWNGAWQDVPVAPFYAAIVLAL